MIRQMKQNRWAGSTTVALLAALSAVLYFSITALASGIVHDPSGDALSATESANNVDPGTPDDVARDYLDIEQVRVKETNGKYKLSMKLAGAIPENMSSEICYGRVGEPFDTTTVLVNPPKPGDCFFAWNWDLSDDAQQETVLTAIAPTVRWINGAFQGVAFSNSGPPVFFDTFTVEGRRITAFVDAAVIDSKLDSSDGFFFVGVSRNHRIDFGGDPLVGVADVTDVGSARLGDSN